MEGENQLPPKIEILRPTAIEAVIAKEHDGQCVFMTSDAPALGHLRVLAPRLVKLPAAHLAGRFIEAVQRIPAYNAGLQFVLFVR